LAIPNISTAEVMAQQGWDSLTIDMQHGLADHQMALAMLTAISTAKISVTPMARVPWLEEGIIMRMLDAGCEGIICPMINTQDDARRFVRACNYPPKGSRSYGPIRALVHAGPDYHKAANDEVLSIGMIETREALDNLDSILDVDELDAVYIGPADLSLALGCTPKFDQEEQPVVEAIEHIIETAKSRGKRVGVHNATVAYARRMTALGADFVSVSSDMRLMTAGAAAVVRKFRESEPEPKSEASY
ncbi:MAG: aldolase/citrate lyase family protein, partial [Verrucomicrobiota bacterium]